MIIIIADIIIIIILKKFLFQFANRWPSLQLVDKLFWVLQYAMLHKCPRKSLFIFYELQRRSFWPLLRIFVVALKIKKGKESGRGADRKTLQYCEAHDAIEA